MENRKGCGDWANPCPPSILYPKAWSTPFDFASALGSGFLAPFSGFSSFFLSLPIYVDGALWSVSDTTQPSPPPTTTTHHWAYDGVV